VAHQPSPMTTGTPAYAIALAKRASERGKVAIYAGAGISVAQLTGIPLGAGVAQTIHATLRTAFPQLEEVDPADLIAVADAYYLDAGRLTGPIGVGGGRRNVSLDNNLCSGRKV
jgi:hypothetical protein